MAVLDRGGLIRNLDYIGDRRLPAKTYLHNFMHERGQYFILKASSDYFKMVLQYCPKKLSFNLDVFEYQFDANLMKFHTSFVNQIDLMIILFPQKIHC